MKRKLAFGSVIATLFIISFSLNNILHMIIRNEVSQSMHFYLQMFATIFSIVLTLFVLILVISLWKMSERFLDMLVPSYNINKTRTRLFICFLTLPLLLSLINFTFIESYTTMLIWNDGECTENFLIWTTGTWILYQYSIQSICLFLLKIIDFVADWRDKPSQVDQYSHRYMIT